MFPAVPPKFLEDTSVRSPLLPLLPLPMLLALSGSAAGQVPPSKITMPSIVPINKTFDFCLEAPGNSFIVLLVSSSTGSTHTKYGTLGLNFPFLLVIPSTMPSGGSLCFRSIAHCDRVFPGFSLALQFISVGPAPGQHALSNLVTLTFAEAGVCLPGEHVTFTQGAYTAACPGNNVACLMHTAFASAFPAGLLIGDAGGIDGDHHYAVLLTSANAVQAFQPHGPSQHALDVDATNPTNCAAGELASQLAIAKLNVGLDDAGALQIVKPVPTNESTGDMIFLLGVHPLLVGWTVRDVIALADNAISGALPMPTDVDHDGHTDVTFAELSTALRNFNENYSDGNGNNFILAEPVP